MNQRITIVGIMILLCCIGLIGCTSSTVKIANMEDLTAHPDNYIGDTITLRGVLVRNRNLDGTASYKLMQFQPSISKVVLTFTKNASASILKNGVEYYVTGVFKLHTGVNEYGYLEVTQVKEIS